MLSGVVVETYISRCGPGDPKDALSKLLVLRIITLSILHDVLLKSVFAKECPMGTFALMPIRLSPRFITINSEPLCCQHAEVNSSSRDDQ